MYGYKVSTTPTMPAIILLRAHARRSHDISAYANANSLRNYAHT